MDRRRTRRGKPEPTNFWQGFLFKFSSRLFIGIVVIVVFLTLAQCTVKSPESPTWNTTFVVPVVNRTYTMEELVSKVDQDEIFIDTNGSVAFSIEEDIDTVQLNEDDFSVPDLSYDLSETLGLIEISTPSDEISVIDIDSLMAGFPVVPGFDTIIVPANTELSADNNRKLDSFTWAEIASGSIQVNVTNRLGLTLYDVVVRLIDARAGVTIDTGYFTLPLNHNEEDSLVISVAGKNISDSVQVTVFSHSDPMQDIHIAPVGKSITTEVSFREGILVTAAMAEVPELEDLPFSQRVGLDIDASETIDTARLAGGELELAVTNNTPLPATLDIAVPNLELSGNSLAISRQISAGQTLLINQNLAGYDLIPEGDSVDVVIVAHLPGSGGQSVIVHYTDSFSVNAALINLTFNSVTGVFDNTSAAFEDIHEELDVPDGFDNVGLVAAFLTLRIENGVDMPGHLDIQLSGDNGKVLNISGDIEARGDDLYRVSDITNDDVADFLTPLPSAVDISGSVEFGDGSYHGTITANDYVFARVSIYAPLGVKLSEAEITDLDVEVEEIEQDDIDAITDHVINSRFIYSIANHLPLGVTATVHLSGDSVSLYTTPQLTLDTLRCEPAPVSLVTGIASAEAISSGEIVLDSTDIQILKNEMLYIRQQLFLSGSDTAGVLLTENDYITINGRIEVEYRFDGEF
ncbi:MAG: hypothetical protein AB1483_10745 [Candidatus Zixiibacteriota bacterium]